MDRKDAANPGSALLTMVICALIVWTWLNQLWDSLTSSSDTSSDTTSPAQTATVSFEVVDELASQTYHEADRVIARPNITIGGLGSPGAVGRSVGLNNVNSESIDLSGGEGSAELDYGDWVFEVHEKNQTVGQQEHTLKIGVDSDHIGLPVTPYIVNVQVMLGPQRAPAKQAEVTVTADVEGWQHKTRTNPDGQVQVQVPRSASRVTFTAKTGTAEPVEADYRIDRAVQDGVTLAVGAETGNMEIETRVGERAWPGVDVQITPVSEEAKAYTDKGTVNTDSNGHRQVQNLPTGEYEVSAHPQLDGVETIAATERVTIRADGTADVTIDVGLSYSVSGVHREWSSDLRDRIEQVTTAPDRDMAIPRYYGTVLTSVLNLVDTVESSPERVVEAGISPDATVEAVLSATDAGLTALKTAISDRGTIQVCEAAESMPETEVRWDGEVTLDALFHRLSEGGDHGRSALRNRLNEVNDVLKQRWSEVAEIAPARKLHTQVEDLAQDVDTADDELAVVAHVFVGIYLLDAIEELFEHDSLTDRLNSISY